MWEIIKIIFYYSFSIVVVLVAVAVVLILFITLFIYFINLFKNRPTTLKGCASSILMGSLAIFIFLIIVFVALAVSVYVLGFSEDEDYEYRLDKKYEKISDTETISENQILVTVKKTGRFGGGRRSTPPSIDIYMKNYNDAAFKGSITIHIMLHGEAIDEREFEIDLGVEGFTSGVVFPRDFDIGDRSWRNIWKEIEIDYSLDGEFKK